MVQLLHPYMTIGKIIALTRWTFTGKVMSLLFNMLSKLSVEELMLLNCGVGVPWTARRSNQSVLKEINPEYSIGRTDAEDDALILWPPDAKNWLTGKDPDARKDWEKAMAPHSSTLAWKIPWTEKPGGLQSMGSLRVGHD